MLTFFVSSSLLTRFAGDKKSKVDEIYKQDGQRNWTQVLCNGGIPTIIAAIYAVYVGAAHVPFLHGCALLWSSLLHASIACCGACWRRVCACRYITLSPHTSNLMNLGEFRACTSTLLRAHLCCPEHTAEACRGVATTATGLQAAVLGYYGCACGDTWASEIGVLTNGPTWLIGSPRRVRKGTNGGISLLGLTFSAAGGLLIGVVGWLFAIVGHGSSEVRLCILGIVCFGCAYTAEPKTSCRDPMNGMVLQS